MFSSSSSGFLLGVGNKQDYAHAHGWELHLSADLIDPAVTAVSLATGDQCRNQA
jgi:hypothetical protein